MRWKPRSAALHARARTISAAASRRRSQQNGGLRWHVRAAKNFHRNPLLRDRSLPVAAGEAAVRARFDSSKVTPREKYFPSQQLERDKPVAATHLPDSELGHARTAQDDRARLLVDRDPNHLAAGADRWFVINEVFGEIRGSLSAAIAFGNREACMSLAAEAEWGPRPSSAVGEHRPRCPPDCVVLLLAGPQSVNSVAGDVPDQSGIGERIC